MPPYEKSFNVSNFANQVEEAQCHPMPCPFIPRRAEVTSLPASAGNKMMFIPLQKP
jgi:hypothetical protein